MANSISPGFAKIKYTGATLTHYQILPLQPNGTPVVGVNGQLILKDASLSTFSAAIDAYIAVLKAEVPATVTFVSAEYWSKPTADDDPIWIYTHPLAVVGTNATGTDELKQRVISYRTGLGGGGFNYLLQIPTAVGVNARQNFPSGNALANATLAYIIGNSSFIIGRDGGRPIVGNWYTTKYNDNARKKKLQL